MLNVIRIATGEIIEVEDLTIERHGQRACLFCKWFVGDFSDKENDVTDADGFCRRYPPTYVSNDAASMQPDVISLDGCGEFTDGWKYIAANTPPPSVDVQKEFADIQDAIRNTHTWPIGSVATPEYLAEQERKNKDVRAMLDEKFKADMRNEDFRTRAAVVGQVDRLLFLLAHAVQQADDHHDAENGGPIKGDPLMDEARALVAAQQAPSLWNGKERRKIWSHLKGKPFAFRRFGVKHPLIEDAAYGTEMVERRVLPDRRGAVSPAPTSEPIADKIAAIIDSDSDDFKMGLASGRRHAGISDVLGQIAKGMILQRKARMELRAEMEAAGVKFGDDAAPPAPTFDVWWKDNEQRYSDDALHMSEYHMASVVWDAALNAKAPPMDGLTGDNTGTRSVRDATAFMIENKTDVMEMYYQHEGKRINVELRILKVENHE